MPVTTPIVTRAAPDYPILVLVEYEQFHDSGSNSMPVLVPHGMTCADGVTLIDTLLKEHRRKYDEAEGTSAEFDWEPVDYLEKHGLVVPEWDTADQQI